MNILNLCDINDKTENIYHEELTKYYEDGWINSRKFDTEENPSEFLLNLISDHMRFRYDLIVGHGFGGLLALIIGRITGVKTILINPMYPASRYWNEFLPDYEYAEFFEDITEKDICWDTHGKTTENIYLILGRDDDLIDTATTDKYLTPGNSFYVEGGHWPLGEDFVLKFGELAGGLTPTGDGSSEKNDIDEQYSLTTLSEFIKANEDNRLLYLYSFEEEDDELLTKVSKKYLSSLKESNDAKCRYITADSLPTEESEVREDFKDVDFLVIDKIVKIVLSDAVRRSLWIACDEVIGHGGKVLLLSNQSAHDLFKEDKDLMDLFFTGLIKQIWAEEMKGFKSKGLRISVDSHCSTDTRPFKDYYRTVIIDDIKTKYGNLAIKWHSPELANRELCLYFKDGQWLYDGKDGWCSDSEAKAVLRAAVDKFVDSAKRTEHDAHHFFGWGW